MIAQSPERAEAQTNYSPLYEPRQGHIFDSCCLSLQSLDVFHKLRPISHGNMKFHLCSQMTNGLAFDSRVQTLMKQNSGCVVSANGRCRIWPCVRPQGLTPSLASTCLPKPHFQPAVVKVLGSGWLLEDLTNLCVGRAFSEKGKCQYQGSDVIPCNVHPSFLEPLVPVSTREQWAS